jgi:hypothetical protein
MTAWIAFVTAWDVIADVMVISVLAAVPGQEDWCDLPVQSRPGSWGGVATGPIIWQFGIQIFRFG